MMKAFNNAATDLRGGWQPSLSLELALAEVLDAPAAPTQQPIAAIHPKSQPAQTASTPVGITEGATGPDAEKVDSQPQPPPQKPSIDASDIIKAWKHMSAALPKSQANLSALMNSVKMIDVQHGMLILGLASEVLVSKIDKPDQIEAIQKLIRDEFGVEMPVRCMVTTARGKIPPNVPQDGMVATAIQHGGEIVDNL
jgi:hypothetical protein